MQTGDQSAIIGNIREQAAEVAATSPGQGWRWDPWLPHVKPSNARG
jgi:hypothetical protein